MAKDLEVAILFADVVGSTQLFDKYGDTKASATVALCLEVMKDATYQFDGTVIKTIGDEVLSTFTTVDDAMSAAAQMQARICADKNDNDDDDRISVSIRIGCHFGPVVQDQNDIFGSAVPARMAAHQGIPAIAISGIDEDRLEGAIGLVVSWVAELVRSPGVRELQPGEYLTIALPPVPPSQIRGVGVAPHASHISKFDFVRDGTRHNRDLWRLSGDNVATPERDTDIDLVLQQGLISITPMRVGEESGVLLEAWRARLDSLPPWPEVH